MEDINTFPLPEVYRRLRATGLVDPLLDLARREDLGPDGIDATSQVMVEEGELGAAAIVARAGGVIAGLEVLPDLLRAFKSSATLRLSAADGQRIPARTVVGELRGPKRELLTVERTALNLLGRLSGIATLTARYVEAVAGTRAAIYDTRKTTPGLRVLEKYAVRCGGGCCHRLGLHDALLIKDNHLAGLDAASARRTVERAAAEARRRWPDLQFVEVEVDSLEQLSSLLDLPPGVLDVVLLDNMDLPTLREAVRMRDGSRSRPRLEASGGVRLETVRAIAETGVERISAGALTHSAASLDVALDMLAGGPWKT